MDNRLRNAQRKAWSDWNDWHAWQALANAMTRAGEGEEAFAMLCEQARATRERADAHRPSVIRPEDYSYAFSIYWGTWPNRIDLANREHLLDLSCRNLTFVKAKGSAKGSQCDVCGSWYTHGAVFRHAPSGKHVVLGWICAGKLELMDAEAFRAQKPPRASKPSRESLSP